MEIVKDIASIASPVIILLFGIFILRKVESIKNQTAKQFEFSSKWAGEFYASSHEFLTAIERHVSLLHFLNGLKDQNDTHGMSAQKEIAELHLKIPELHLRFKRFLVFAHSARERVLDKSQNLLNEVGKLVSTGRGSLDNVVVLIDDLNRDIKVAHAEMLKGETIKIY